MRFMVENSQFWGWNANLGSKSRNRKATNRPGLGSSAKTLGMA